MRDYCKRLNEGSSLNEIGIYFEQGGSLKDYKREEILTFCKTIFKQALQGTCLESEKSILENYFNLENYNDLFKFVDEYEVLTVLDEVVFECECCGWWYERAEEAENGICENCIYED